MALLPNRRSLMTLYSDERDPACHAVRFVLAEKAISADIVNVSFEERPEDLLELNPYEDVLTLVDRDLVLYEPQIIMEYLDERFPHPPLMPVAPVERAKSRLFRFRIKRDLHDYVRRMCDPQKSVVEAARKELRDNLTAIAPIFSQTKFFMSDDYSLVDCFIAPVLWRLPSLDIQLPGEARTMSRYGDKLFAREAFVSSLTETEKEMHQG